MNGSEWITAAAAVMAAAASLYSAVSRGAIMLAIKKVEWSLTTHSAEAQKRDERLTSVERELIEHRSNPFAHTRREPT